MEQKQKLRNRYKQIRRDIPPQERKEKSKAICEHLLNSSEYAEYQQILVYAAIQSEAELHEFCEQAWKDNKSLYFPRVQDKDMEFYRIRAWGQLKEGSFHVPEPDVAGYDLEIYDGTTKAWMLVPGVAFDADGWRMGYGGGFYDRYLDRFLNLHLTGIAFGEQIAEQIPVEVYDHRMDDVITEQQWYRPDGTKTGGEANGCKIRGTL